MSYHSRRLPLLEAAGAGVPHRRQDPHHDVQATILRTLVVPAKGRGLYYAMPLAGRFALPLWDLPSKIPS